jgi:glutathione S-transferase
MVQAFWQLVRTPPRKRDCAAVEASRVKSEKLSAILDRAPRRARIRRGDAFSPADIVVGCAAHRWLGLPWRASRAPTSSAGTRRSSRGRARAR